MAVCFFTNDYDTRYNCEYEVKGKGIEVTVDYDINDEIPLINGIRTYGSNTKFNDRDILIIDYKNRKNYLLKDAYYRGQSEVWGTPDGGAKTKFYSYWYFLHANFDKLCELKKTPKVNKIKIYSNLVNEFIGYPSLLTLTNDDEYAINLKKDSQSKTIEINKHNIKNVIIGDCWYGKHNGKDHSIDIKLNGYIELELNKRVNYKEVYDYVYELIIFIQLLVPEMFNIPRISVYVDDIQYGLYVPLEDRTYKVGSVQTTVKDDILHFLKKCYDLIPYRKSKTEVRNIPYIVLNTYRGLENNFLMFYRFIECYYKKQNKKGIANMFIRYSIENNYKKVTEMNSDEIENLSQEIISLRNHYVHSGYYIKNKSLKITFKNIDETTPNPKNYTVNNVDVKWIYERTKILYDVVLDILFSNMLNYKNYKFNKHF